VHFVLFSDIFFAIFTSVFQAKMFRHIFTFFVVFLVSISTLAQVYSGHSYHTDAKLDAWRFPCFIDTSNNILYTAGYYDTIANTLRRNISAFDLKTGALLAWNPVVSGGKVNSIVKSGNTVYIGGTFTTVNGLTRNRLAAINATSGVLLSWNPNPNNEVLSLAVDNNYLYVGGRYTSIAASARNFLSVFNVSNGSLYSWSPPLQSTNIYFDEIKVSGSNIYGISTNTGIINCVYKISFGTPVKNLIAKAGGGFINDYLVYNSNVYCVGYFTSINDSLRKNGACVRVLDSLVLPWKPALNSTATLANYRIENYKDTFFISSRVFGSDTARNYIKRFSPIGKGRFISLFKYYDAANDVGANDLVISSDKMVETWYDKILTTEYCKNRLSVYCFKPGAPQPFSVSSASVCVGQQGVVFTLPAAQGYDHCEWSYTGTGATINGDSSSVTIDFSLSATTGILKVKGVNICGIKSAEKTFTITVNPLPNANAGQDDTLTCFNPSLTLYGTSDTASVSYVWSYLGSAISPFSSVLISSGGTYTLTVTKSATGCKNTDIVNIEMDTVSPVIQSLSRYDTLTCISPSKILNASTLNVLDSIRWLDASGQGFSNPYQVVSPGNFVCFAMNSKNGCIARDTVTVIENKIAPQLSIDFVDTLITCKKDSALLIGSSTDLSVEIKWITTDGDTIFNPAYSYSSGWQVLMVTNTMNGCITSAQTFVDEDKNFPVITLADSVLLTCSYPSAQVNALAYPVNAIIDWSGQANPITISIPGKYILTASDTSNGCASRDSTIATYKPLLAINAGDDTLICNNSSAMLSGNIINGTPAFTFNWNSGLSTSQTVLVAPIDTTTYFLHVTDAGGCYGDDTVIVFMASILGDSVASFVPCEENGVGELHVFASGGIPPYQYSINSGTLFQSGSVFDSLQLGTYYLLIKDTLGCTRIDSATINENSFKPEVNFLVSTNFYSTDTLVLVDISNPRPDTVIWQFPVGITVINQDPFAPVIVSTDTGSFFVTMQAVYGDCIMEQTKQIHIVPFDSLAANNSNNNGIKSISVSPNPNTGNFQADVELYLKQTFVVLVIDASGIERYREVISEQDSYSGNIILANPVPGTYVFMIIAEYDAGGKTFVVTQ